MIHGIGHAEEIVGSSRAVPGADSTILSAIIFTDTHLF